MDKAGDHLRWIRRNCGAVYNPERVGITICAFLSRGLGEKPSRLSEIYGVLERQGGETLRRQIRAARLFHRVLYLEVDDTVALYQLRLQWEQKLLGVLQEELKTRSIQAVRFTTRGYDH